MSTKLATAAQLHHSLELSDSDREAAQAVAAGIRDAKAGSTRRTYASAWQQFQTWADAGGHLAANGQAIASIEKARAAISHFHASADALTTEALARIREVLRLPRRGRGGTDGITRDRPAAGHPGPGRHRSPGRRRAETIRGLGTDLEGRGTVAGRYGADNPAEGQEPAGATDGSGNNSHRPVPPGDPTGEHRPLSSGVRSDRRDPGQPGPCCRQRRRPGRGLQRT